MHLVVLMVLLLLLRTYLETLSVPLTTVRILCWPEVSLLLCAHEETKPYLYVLAQMPLCPYAAADPSATVLTGEDQSRL